MTLAKSEKSPLFHTLFSCLTKELNIVLFDWFKILKNLEEKRGRNEDGIHVILHRYSFPVS